MKYILILAFISILAQGYQNLRGTTQITKTDPEELSGSTIDKLVLYSNKRLEGNWIVMKNSTKASVDDSPLFTMENGLIRGNYYYDSQRKSMNFTFNLIEGKYNDDRLLSFSLYQAAQ